MQLVGNLTTIISLLGFSALEQKYVQVFQDVCKAIVLEHPIETFIYTQSENFRDSRTNLNINIPLVLQKLDTKNPIAVLNIDAETTVEYYSKKFNHNLLSIVQLSGNVAKDEELLKILWQRLRWNRRSFLLLLFDDKDNEVYVTRIMKFCAKAKAINVIGLQPRMAVKELSYWTLQFYPNQKIIRESFKIHYRHLYTNQLDDMQGYPIRALEKTAPPYFYYYTDKRDGKVTLSGYNGRALTSFAERHNATLEFDFSIDNAKLLSSNEIHNYFEMYNADITILRSMSSWSENFRFTVVVAFNYYCLMIPVEKPLSKFTYYYEMMHKSFVILFFCSLIILSFVYATIARWRGQQQVMLIDYFLNISVTQALLGAPVWEQRRILTIQKAITIITLLAGIIVNTAYNTYLQSFMIDGPKEAEVKTIDDLQKHGIKIALNDGVMPYFTNINYTNFSKFRGLSTYFDNYTEFESVRDSFDIRYAYPVAAMWGIIEEQQKYFSKPLFRISEICFERAYYTIVPMAENSILYDAMYEYFLRLREAGLIDHWWRHSFIELLDMDVISLEDRNKKSGFVPLK